MSGINSVNAAFIHFFNQVFRRWNNPVSISPAQPQVSRADRIAGKYCFLIIPCKADGSVCVCGRVDNIKAGASGGNGIAIGNRLNKITGINTESLKSTLETADIFPVQINLLKFSGIIKRWDSKNMIAMIMRQSKSNVFLRVF